MPSPEQKTNHQLTFWAYLNYGIVAYRKDHAEPGYLPWQTHHSQQTVHSMVLDLLSSGMTEQEILEDYSALEHLDIMACLVYASKITRTNTYIKSA